MQFSRRAVASDVPQGSLSDPILFNLSINNLDGGAQCNLRKFAEDTKLGVVADVVLPFRRTEIG